MHFNLLSDAFECLELQFSKGNSEFGILSNIHNISTVFSQLSEQNNGLYKNNKPF